MIETTGRHSLYPWLQPALAHWQKLRQGGRIPQAVLLNGMPGSGKSVLAQALAAALLCENSPSGTDDEIAANSPCGQCPGCQMLAAGTHPDCLLVEPDGQFIKVAQIREVTKKLTLSAHRGGFKVAIIQAAGRMNPAAANALLKTLEEPAENTCLILVSEDSDRLLPTIISRCRPMPVKSPSASELANWLQEDSERVRHALILAGGAPLLAKEWLQHGELDEFRSFLGQLADLAQSPQTARTEVTSLAGQWQEKINSQWLSALSRYLLHLQSLRAGLCRELSGDRQWLTQMRQIFDNSSHLAAKLQELNALRERIGSPLKKELLLEEFLINWKNSFH